MADTMGTPLSPDYTQMSHPGQPSVTQAAPHMADKMGTPPSPDYTQMSPLSQPSVTQAALTWQIRWVHPISKKT